MLSLRRMVLMTVLFFMFLPVLRVAMHTASAASQAETIFEYDFESGWGDWYTDNGVWEIGTPTAGPSASHGGTQCAATVLSGSYPAYTDGRLISPSVTLSSVSGDEELSFRFWHWFSYSSYDYGYTQISTYDSTSGTWSDWETLGNTIQSSSGAWSYHKVDITSYAGKKVRIAFYHTADRYNSYNSNESTGWYIDDILIIKKVPEFTGGFESGWGDWYTDNGVWEIGTPTAGPSASHGGAQCVGTVLSGSYPAYTDGRLISPSVTLSSVSGDEELSIRFWHWFSYSSYDYGYTQISTYDSTSGKWSAWETLGSTIQSSSGAWSYHKVDITSYAGKKVRIAFYHTADRYYSYNSNESTGWYIDDIEITGIATPTTPVPSPSPTGTIPTPTPTPAVSPTPTPSVSPVPTPTPSPVTTPSPSPIQTPSPSVSPTLPPLPTPVISPTLPPLPTSSPTPTTSPLKEGMVYGTVNDSYEDTLEGVTVTIEGEGISESTETDEDGYYEFQELAAGDYTLTYEFEGYVTKTQEINLDEGEEKDLGTITMPVMSSIYGYVVNVREEPINKARLKIKGINTKYVKTGYSDADGYFDFTELEADTYLIFVRKKGYLPKKLRVKLREEEEKDVGEIILRRKS